jgi:predicted nucleic acid-binding protein
LSGEIKKRIYIDTSIPSAYYTSRTDEGSLARQRVTQQWWDQYADLFILTSSPAVIEELNDGRSEKTRDRLALVENLEILPITAEILQITQLYIDRLIMPQDPAGDALHLAIASFHRMDTLLTWNRSHIANPNKIPLIQRINRELGLATPELTTPLHYLGGSG